MSEMTDRDIAIENIRNSALPTSRDNVENLIKVSSRITKNVKPFYNNTSSEKDVILHHLSQKFSTAQLENDVAVINGKNLLYFTIFLNDTYLEILQMCLKSIVANTPNINFDILFITDSATKLKIQQFQVLSHFNVDYMLVPSATSGPDASLNKLNIFSYNKISDYSKVLFFDVDILCIRDLNIIFQKPLEQERLYVCSNEIHKSPLLLTPTHGIMYLSQNDAAFLYDNPDIIPFNSGQFMFLNSSRMKKHFDNVIWLKNVWPDKYFYEQSFMNYYFVLRSLTKPLNVIFKRKVMMPEITGNEVSVVEREIEYTEPLISVTFNISKKLPNEEDILKSLLRIKTLSRTKSLMTVTGATDSNFSKNSMTKYTMMPEGILTEPLLMHSENTVAIHFVATVSRAEEKKTFMELYANAHKLHI